MPKWHKEPGADRYTLMPKWHKVRWKKAAFLPNLMPKWHKPYAKMAQPKCSEVLLIAAHIEPQGEPQPAPQKAGIA